jgi:sulfur-oxidizing protein SoxY
MSSDETSATRHVASRRLVLRGASLAALAACGFPGRVWAQAGADSRAFRSASSAEAMAALGDIVADDPRVKLSAPDVADNGAIVPIAIECQLPAVDAVYVVVDSNPQPMAVGFDLHPGVEPSISLRIKMADSGTIHAIVRSGGRLYATSKATSVTVGGCG